MTFDQFIDQVLGPGGALVGALATVIVLWREHVKHDADTRAQRDIAVIGWRDQTAATNRIGDAMEQMVRDQAGRQRRGDS